MITTGVSVLEKYCENTKNVPGSKSTIKLAIKLSIICLGIINFEKYTSRAMPLQSNEAIALIVQVFGTQPVRRV